jgi:hypothetical protein
MVARLGDAARGSDFSDSGDECITGCSVGDTDEGGNKMGGGPCGWVCDGALGKP